ncbi:hypothetical protein D3C74_491840 [compost metagenome]
MLHIVLGEDDDHDRAAHSVVGAATGGAQGRGQTRDAEGEAGGGHGLAGEPRHQIVIATAAADGAEANGPALVVLGVQQ